MRTVHVSPFNHEDEVVASLLEAIKAGRCAVWVRNTIADTVSAWQRWQEEFPEFAATLFHARFALIDRLTIGGNVLRDFGPSSDASSRQGRLVIASQVIEQSLDVDFDSMVTDLAPIDLVIQRAGRLQRHIRDKHGNRLDGRRKRDQRGGALLGILMPEPWIDADKNWYKTLLPKAGRVYSDHARLWLTAKWLADNGRFAMPEDARNMIEAVYGDDISAVPEALRSHLDNTFASGSADRSIASYNSLSYDSGYDPTGYNWKDDDNAPTRLGEATVRVRLAKIVENSVLPWADGPKGMEWVMSEVAVPARLIAGETPKPEMLIRAAKLTMPDEGRYRVVVPLKQKEEDGWLGSAVNLGGEPVTVAYSRLAGLTTEKGVDDESDL